MKSLHHGTAVANANLKGKRTKLLGCRCCQLINFRWSERWREASREIKAAEKTLS